MALLKKDYHHRRAGDVTIFLFLLVGAAFMLLPLVYTIANALKPMEELWEFPPKFWVRRPTMQNFTDLMSVMQNSLVPLSKYLYNTLFITIVGTGGHLILASMCAYAFTKRTFRGRDLMFTLVVFSLMFNGTVTSIPNFMIVSWLNLLDTQWALIIPAFGYSLCLYLRSSLWNKYRMCYWKRRNRRSR